MNSHRSSHTHCQAAQSQAQTKACQRVCLPQPIENFKIFLPLFTEKIKTLQHTSDTDRKENDTNDKFNMKVQFDSNLRTDKNRQCITGGIFYCRDSAGFSVSASNKLSCNLTVKCFEIGNKIIPPNRYAQAEKRQRHSKLTMKMEY
jgi:hypothetical protein